jgi:hypothetical protein
MPARIITEATRPPKSKTRWSIRSMSRHAGISAIGAAHLVEE